MKYTATSALASLRAELMEAKETIQHLLCYPGALKPLLEDYLPNVSKTKHAFSNSVFSLTLLYTVL